MPRQSITLTEPNDAWLREHVEGTQDYASKSELINDLIRRARRSEVINQKLEAAEQSGFVEQSAKEMLEEFKKDVR
jgi:antitoxin ParD1/3/4